MHRLKFLFLADFSADGEISGGVQAAASNLFEGLKCFASTHDIYFVSISKKIANDKYVKKDNINCHYLKSDHSLLKKPHFFWDIPKVLRVIQQIKPDAINIIDHATMALAALKYACPKLFTIHGIKKIEARIWKGKEYFSHQADAIIERYVHKKFKNFISISPYVRSLLEIQNINGNNIFNIPNAVSRYYFQHENSSHKEQCLTILNIGAYTRLKSQHILLEAVNQLQEDMPIKCILCGNIDDPKYFKYLKKYQKKIDHLKLLNLQSKQQIRKLMQTSSLLVHTSRQENTPIVFLEAMASKLPIISSKVGGVPFLLRNSSFGHMYEYGNVQSLKKLIKAFYQDQQKFSEKAVDAYEVVKNENIPKIVAKKTLDALHSIVQ